MKQISLILGILAASLFCIGTASAQVSVTYSSGYGVYRPSVTVSVGNSGYYQTGYPYPYPGNYPAAYPNTYPVAYPTTYPVAYPVRVRGRGHHRGYYQRGYQTCNQGYWCPRHNQYCTH